uniref:Putative nhl repeat-containing protein 2 n=1 Tax=Anopheles marajoara TaxID=58244 RepID=A0A2M4BDL8_9DIPT
MELFVRRALRPVFLRAICQTKSASATAFRRCTAGGDRTSPTIKTIQTSAQRHGNGIALGTSSSSFASSCSRCFHSFTLPSHRHPPPSGIVRAPSLPTTVSKIGTRMSSSPEGQDMMEVLAGNSNQLADDICAAGSNAGKRQKLVMEYLKAADRDGKSVSAEFPDGLDWFNVTEPLTLQGSLRGKVVVLDFFTYCCINCMHILPNLKRLEHLYPIEQGLAVVGVHSAKFRNEKDSNNIRAAVERYEITHPVVNDNVMAMWRKLRVQCWPTLMILGPRANPLFVILGEGNYDDLKLYVGSAIRYYREKGELRTHSLPIDLSHTAGLASHLKFPGKVVCCEAGEEELYAVSDSGNHRILIFEPNGTVRYTIGGKASGFVDGGFREARFNAPQGVAFRGGSELYVADNENHAIRLIDLRTRTVSTVAGNGVQGNDRTGGKKGREQTLSSPWDVAVYSTRDLDMSFHVDESKAPLKDVLLIAIAGIHQIWAIFLEDTIWWKFKKYSAGSCCAIAGSGHEQNRNTSYPLSAAFAQPSGLAINREVKEVYLADSESSAIRKISLTDGKVMAVAGGDRNPLDLFAFGDIDGKGYEAKFQHPLGVAYNAKDGHIYVADTYNHKIKKIDASTNCATTCEFRGANGEIKRFSEPAGLCLDRTGQLLFIADTNNHELLVASLPDGTIRPLKLHFPVPEEMDSSSADDRGTVLRSKHPIKLHLGGGAAVSMLRLLFNFSFAGKGTKLTEGAPQRWSLTLPSTDWGCEQTNGSLDGAQPLTLPITVPQGRELSANGNPVTIEIDFNLNLCEGDLCFPKQFTVRLDVRQEQDDDGDDTSKANNESEQRYEVQLSRATIALKDN